MRIDRNFFERDTLIVAKELLGKYLVRTQNIKNEKQKIWIGKIVETEAYIGEDDLACHASKGKTPRTQIMYGEAGHAYVYLIYGMYNCLNIVTEKAGFPAAVLIRAVEPVDLPELMKCVTYSVIPTAEPESRNNRKGDWSGCRIKSDMTSKELKKLANGPGKLCRWMEIDRNLNGADITNSEELYISEEIPKNVILATSVKRERPESNDSLDSRLRGNDRKWRLDIVEARRVGVDYAKHCADHPWRFYIKGNEFVSRK